MGKRTSKINIGNIKVVHHKYGAIGLRLFGLGPSWRPSQGLLKLKELFDNHSFWAKDRSLGQMKKMLLSSNIVISIWLEKKLIGFGRCTGDGVYRAVLWDIIVAQEFHRIGVGQIIINAILSTKFIKNTEKVYVMTSKRKDFYRKVGFKENEQTLLLKNLRYIN
tara:strand:- start:443 stop:934 length:492 start_codon:yes stop_codon:yes gene_type:complete